MAKLYYEELFNFLIETSSKLEETREEIITFLADTWFNTEDKKDIEAILDYVNCAISRLEIKSELCCKHIPDTLRNK